MIALLIMIVSKHSKLVNDVDIALQLPIPITIPALNHNSLSLNNNKFSLPQHLLCLLWEKIQCFVLLYWWMHAWLARIMCIWTEFMVVQL